MFSFSTANKKRKLEDDVEEKHPVDILMDNQEHRKGGVKRNSSKQLPVLMRAHNAFHAENIDAHILAMPELVRKKIWRYMVMQDEPIKVYGDFKNTEKSRSPR